MICNFIINPALSVFTFHFTGNEDNTLGDITITEGSNGKTIQTIVNTTSYDATLTQATATLALVDANFDGYNDLQILNNCGVTGNCSYDFYLYDSATNQFVQNAFLSGLGTPTFDVAKQQVRTSWNSSAGDWEADTYQYENSHYTVVHQEISTWNRNANTVTVDTYNLLDGQMKLTNSSTTPF